MDAAPLTRGSLFHGRYEIVRCIKAGGMGAVYEVIHTQTRRRCALKVMLPSLVIDAEMRARFQLEATVAADVHSEHIVETYDAGVDEPTGTPFIVMELLRGEELASVIERRGRVPHDEAVELLRQAALALDRTHAAGIVHRDLKPENLFVTSRDDGSPRLKVLDFGIAKVVARSAAAAKSTRGMGTPLYMAPEQVRDGVGIGPHTDVFALGHIAYAMVVGEAYWEEDVQTCDTLYPVLMKIASGPEEPPTVRAQRRNGVTLPPAFDVWFARATDRVPANRFARASELVRALAEVFQTAPSQPVVVPSSSGPSVSAHAPTLHTTDPSSPTVVQPSIPHAEASISGIASRTGAAPPPRGRPLAAFGAVAIVVLAAGGWWLLRSPPTTPPVAAAEDASSVREAPAGPSPTVTVQSPEPAVEAPADAPSSAAPQTPARAIGARPATPARSAQRPATGPKDPLDVR